MPQHATFEWRSLREWYCHGVLDGPIGTGVLRATPRTLGVSCLLGFQGRDVPYVFWSLFLFTVWAIKSASNRSLARWVRSRNPAAAR